MRRTRMRGIRLNNIQLLSEPVASEKTTKPIELYVFIDPLCPNAFKMQSMLKKLQLEYEHYFTWRYVLSTELTTLNCVTRRIKGCLTGADVDITHPALPSLAIKAAELQGKKRRTVISGSCRNTYYWKRKTSSPIRL